MVFYNIVFVVFEVLKGYGLFVFKLIDFVYFVC